MFLSLPIPIFSTSSGGERLRLKLQRNLWSILWRKAAPYTDDILVGIGLLIMVVTTFTWSAIAGGYTLAASFIGAGYILARQPPKRR